MPMLTTSNGRSARSGKSLSIIRRAGTAALIVRADAGVMQMVRAAGGVVERDGLVLLVHRPKYDDWTFPKGKAEAGETDEACALREVHEETGLECRLLDELPATEYVDSGGRPKRVRWWRMQVVGGELAPSAEVDELRWLAPADATQLLTYRRDLALLAPRS
jgi:8-oxo-dGTP diphosphatase